MSLVPLYKEKRTRSHEKRSRSEVRSLEAFLESGANLKRAKLFTNVITIPMFDIKIDHVKRRR